MKGAVVEFTVPAMVEYVRGTEFIMETKDAVGSGFGGVEVEVGSFEGSEFFKGEVFWEVFDREVGKIVGHSMEVWGPTWRVFIHVEGVAD